MRRTAIGMSFLLILLTCGCTALGRDIEVSSLMQKKRHHEAIRILQGDLDAKADVSSFQLYLLGGAYYEIRDYERMLKTVDLMERKIAGGDVEIYGANLSPYPGIMRGYAYLDQGEYEKAVRTVSEASALLNRIGQRSNGFYHSQLIEINGILGFAQANLNRKRDGIAVKKRLGALDLDRDVREFRTALTDPASRDHMLRSQDLYRKLIGPVAFSMPGRARSSPRSGKWTIGRRAT
ncbi:MAG: hypothetical protein CVU61_17505 [Deltaproteobacteria bacterium HGW-Deltaproteobacteria-19]|jgi:tetratricopeptide (TPR) repeat protein|nr:MAG: hypothetical protein CVU61_17505 [Deltaproteobacteria bacterium HGW-Deltaproteobacteria-19]